MKNTLCLFAMMTLLTSGPSFAKEVQEFPSRSIRPVISNAEADRFGGQTKPESRQTQSVARALPDSQRNCARPYNARDERNRNDRNECQTDSSPVPQSDIPQLRAFRQPSTPRFAP